MGESACLLHMPSYCLVLRAAEARTLGWLQKETWKLTPSLILFAVQRPTEPLSFLLAAHTHPGGRRKGLPAPRPAGD